MNNTGKWREFTLQELIHSIQPGFARKPTKVGNIAQLRTNNISPKGKLDLSQLKYIVATEKEISKYALQEDDILFNNTNSDIWVGKTAYVNKPLNILYSNHLTRLRVDKNKVNPQFLAIYLQKLQSDGYFKNMSTRWVNQAAINTTFLQSLKLKIPPIADQEKIVSILSQGYDLKQKREYANSLANQLVQAIFLKMFGDPAINAKEYEVSNINNVSIKVTDGEHVTPKRTSSGVKLLSARNIKNGYIDFEEDLDYISIEEYQRIKKRLNVENGDILLSCSGTIGRVTIVNVTEPLSLVRSVALIKPNNSQINAKYLQAYLLTTYMQNQMKKYSHASSQANLFTGQIKELPVVLPPIEMQNDFEQIFNSIELIKLKQKQSTQSLDMLYGSLMSKAFNGELA